MASEPQHDWLGMVWEVAKYILAVLGTAGSTAALWVARRYQHDRAMLIRHEERLERNEKELGDSVAFRKLVGDGPMGLGLIQEIEKLQDEDRRLHGRVNRRRKEHGEIEKEIAAMKTDIRWIRKFLENGGSEE